MSRLPDYFFTIAASSTGKYHPAYALGDGGLVRHTKAAVMIARELLSLEMYKRYTPEQRDLIYAALILHDGLKHGEKQSKYTIATHPTVMADWIADNFSAMLTDGQLSTLCSAIASHMGQWNTDYKSKKEILPKPVTPMQKFVHQCDYLASRKYLEFEFGDGYYKPEDFAGEEELPPVTAGLETLKAKIHARCKRLMDDGFDIDAMYELIAKHNGGKRNFQSVKSAEAAQKIYDELEAVQV